MEEERIDIDKMERSRFAEGKNRLYFLNGLDQDQELFGETDLYADAEEEKEVRISKYMSLENALNILEEEELYLANPSVWQDPFERLFIKAEYELNGENKRFNDLLPDNKYLYCTCFTQCFQSDAQWKMYNDHEIAVMIDFDVKKLFKKLSNFRNDLYIGKAKYIEGGWNKVRELDEKTRDAIKNPNDGNHLAALLGLMLRKRINYKYEEEIRLMCLRKPALAKDGSYKSGITVKIPNIKKCITTIRIDPRLGPRTTKAIKEILGKHLQGKVSKSAMNNNASFKKPIQL